MSDGANGVALLSQLRRASPVTAREFVNGCPIRQLTLKSDQVGCSHPVVVTFRSEFSNKLWESTSASSGCLQISYLSETHMAQIVVHGLRGCKGWTRSWKKTIGFNRMLYGKSWKKCRIHLQLVIVRDFPFLDCKVL